MAEGRYYCSICGAAAVPAPGRVCPLHLPASERQLLAGQSGKPSAWVLAAGAEAAAGPAAARLAEAPAPATGLELASVSQRFWAYVIDLLAATVTAGFLAVFASANLSAAVVMGLAGWWGYFLLANSLGQLAGKATLGIKVIDPATGREPGFVKGTLRTVGQALNLMLVLAIGSFTAGIGLLVVVWLMVTWDVRNVTIHDAMAGTIVIRTTPGRR
jgi:uncharacterized RDD family membrane protein YckC